jgi:GntR family transcriptional regulator
VTPADGQTTDPPRRRAAAGAELPRKLSRRSPKGEQLRSILEDLIDLLKPGDPLPSERELAERYDVARMTVRAELTRLASEGMVERIQGRGTFVAEARVAQAAALSSFTEDMRARGHKPGSQVLGQGVVPADDLVARRLEIELGTPVVRVRRVRTADGEPMALERTHLPAQRLPGLESADLADASLYELLERNWGVRVAEADQWASVVRLTADEAALLQVGPDQPALLFQRLTRDPSGAPIEYVRSLYRGDRYEVHTRLERLDS